MSSTAGLLWLLLLFASSVAASSSITSSRFGLTRHHDKIFDQSSLGRWGWRFGGVVLGHRCSGGVDPRLGRRRGLLSVGWK